MSDNKKKKSKKLKKENKKLRKEINDLRKMALDITTKMADMKDAMHEMNTEKKRKRKHSKKDKKEKKRGKKKRRTEGEVPEPSRDTPTPADLLGTPKKKKRNQIAGGVQVSNPFQPGHKITVRDGSYKNNRYLNKIIMDYNKSEPGPAKDKRLDQLGEIFAEAIAKGQTQFDTRSVSSEILQKAVSIYKAKYGGSITIEEDSDDTSKSSTPSSASSSPTPSDSESSGLSPVETFNDDLMKYVIPFTGDLADKGFMESLAAVAPKVYKTLYRDLRRLKSLRFYLEYTVVMSRGFFVAEDGTVLNAEEREVKLSSSGDTGIMETVTKESDVDSSVSSAFQKLLDAVTDYGELGSGFQYLASIKLEIYVSKMIYKTYHYEKARGNEEEEEEGDASVRIQRVGKWLPLPLWVTGAYSCTNPKPPSWKKDDSRCFEWCVLRALHPTPLKHKGGDISDLMQYVGKEVFLPPGVTYPIPLDDKVLRAIEDLNNFTFSIFSIGREDKEVRPLYITDKEKGNGKPHIQLGVVSEGADAHFVLIKSLSALIGRTAGNYKRFFCERCLSAHRSPEAYKAHVEICGKHEPCHIRMPEDGSKHQFIKFESWHKIHPAPFVIYLDFEAVLQPNAGQHGEQNEHLPSSYAYHIKCYYPQHEGIIGACGLPLSEPRVYAGKDCMDNFFRNIFYDTEILMDLVSQEKAYEEKPGDKAMLEAATHCHICRKSLGKERVLDHDHYTGEFRGAAHGSCNLQFTTKKMKFIPVVVHNLKGYDGYHILSNLYKRMDSVQNVDVIAKNLEKFTCITINNVRFIDSLQFINGALEDQAFNLKKSIMDDEPAKLPEFFPEIFKMIRRVAPAEDDLHIDPSVIADVLGKGIYPYEWVDSFEKLEATELPPIEAFYSTLKGGTIAQEDYERGQRMWKLFDCKNLKDFTNLYCKLDTLLLEALFEAFRKACMSEDGNRLDPAHYVTAPSLSWDAMLKMNFDKGVVIENMTDLDMFLMTENGIRGGHCQVLNPYARANPLTDEEIKEYAQDRVTQGGGDRDPFEYMGERDIRIQYYDANNLYGWAMSQPLPLGDYRWEYREVDAIRDRRGKGKRKISMWEDFSNNVDKFLDIKLDSDRGYILEVDVDYPQHLHDLHNDFPLCADSKPATPSLYTQAELARLGLLEARGRGVNKLIMDLQPKIKYVIHYRNLQQAIQLGLQVRKVHRVISFKQSAWLKDYIDFNTEKRKLAKNSIDKEFFKLMNNSIFGKTMEDMRKRRIIKFFTDKTFGKALEDASSTYVKHWRIITPNKLMIMEMAKHKCEMNRPVILGMSILDISKWLMFDFHYNVIKAKFGERARLLYTDTDSLVYMLIGNGLCSVYSELVELQREKNCFDLSETQNMDHPLMKAGFNIKENGKVPGKFKDELFGWEAEEFVAIRSKMYSVKMFPIGKVKDKMKMKGIPNKAVTTLEKRKLQHEDYMKAFEGGDVQTVSFYAIGHSSKFQLETRRVSKLGLTSCDDKSHYFDFADSLRYGHYLIPIKEKSISERYELYDAMASGRLVDEEEEDIDDYVTSWIVAEHDKMVGA